MADPDSLNPLLSTMDLSYDLSSLILSYLVSADAHGTPAGDLATAMPSLANGGISYDGKTYTYHLRGGVRWHDGAPLTARDVAFSWRLIMNPRNNVLHREGYDQVARIDTPDDHTVVVRLKRRYPPFVTQFFTTLQEGAKPVVPEHLLRGAREINDVPFNAHPVGTGPFPFVAWDRGRRITLAANERYFKGRPKLERVELSILPDMNTVATALRTHEVDMPVSSNPLLYDLFRATPGMRAALTDWNSQEILMLDDARPALRHAEVRRAIGINLTIKPYPYKGIYAFDGPIVNGRFDLAVFANTLPYDPASTCTLACDNFAPKGENSRAPAIRPSTCWSAEASPAHPRHSPHRHRIRAAPRVAVSLAYVTDDGAALADADRD